MAYTQNSIMATSNSYDSELQPVSSNFIAIKSNGATQSGPADRDRADLIRLGKNPVLKVGLELLPDFIMNADAFYL